MKKISIILISLLVFLVAISCASAADYDAGVANDTAMSNLNEITDVNDVDFNISSDENLALDIEPLENDTTTNDMIISEDSDSGFVIKPPSHEPGLDIKGPSGNGPNLDIKGPKISVDSKVDSKPYDNIRSGILTTIAGPINPVYLVISIGYFFDWW